MKKNEIEKRTSSEKNLKAYVEPEMSVFECKRQALLYEGSCAGDMAACAED